MITYLKGDATQPQGEGPKIIAHICNDAGGWGRGFVVAVSKRWKEPEAAYRAWHRGESRKGTLGSNAFALGHVQFVVVGRELAVANMVAQKGYGPRGTALHRVEGEESKVPPIRYEALALCLIELGNTARKLKATIHMPRIGCGLAGGTWDRVEPLLQRILEGREVLVYDLPA